MELKIYSQSKDDAILFDLRMDDKELDLVVVDKDGNKVVTVISITPDGSMKIWSGLDTDCNLKLDKDDRIKFTEE